jgi:hypothetical protein
MTVRQHTPGGQHRLARLPEMQPLGEAVDKQVDHLELGQSTRSRITMPCKTDVVVAHTIGIDTGKNTPHMVGLDEKGAIVLREKISRSRIAAWLVNVPPCLIGIMASHYVAR